MIIISDTSPISNLLRINQLAILQKLYDTVIIPPVVHQEISALEELGVDITPIQSAN